MSNGITRVTLKCDDAKNCVILKDDTVVQILNIVENNNTVSIIGKQFNTRGETNLFENPLKCSSLCIFFGAKSLSLSSNKSWPISSIKCIDVCIPYSSMQESFDSDEI